MAVYSTQFFSLQMDPNTIYEVSYTVPAGMVAVVKDATMVGQPTTPSSSGFNLASGAVQFARAMAIDVASLATWRGRQVLLEGEILWGYLLGRETADLNVSGYLLTA